MDLEQLAYPFNPNTIIKKLMQTNTAVLPSALGPSFASD